MFTPYNVKSYLSIYVKYIYIYIYTYIFTFNENNEKSVKRVIFVVTKKQLLSCLFKLI